jgi:hypothetical protein
MHAGNTDNVRVRGGRLGADRLAQLIDRTLERAQFPAHLAQFAVNLLYI